jgi:hypothetical protein
MDLKHINAEPRTLSKRQQYPRIGWEVEAKVEVKLEVRVWNWISNCGPMRVVKQSRRQLPQPGLAKRQMRVSLHVRKAGFGWHSNRLGRPTPSVPAGKDIADAGRVPSRISNLQSFSGSLHTSQRHPSTTRHGKLDANNPVSNKPPP